MAIPFILIPIGGFILNEYYQSKKIKESQKLIELTKETHEKNLKEFNLQRENIIKSLDSLEKKRLEILGSFKIFSDLVEKVVDRPRFKKEIKNIDLKLDNLKLEELKIVSFKSTELLTKINETGIISGTLLSQKALLSISSVGTGILGITTVGIGAIIATNIKTIKVYSDTKKADAFHKEMKEAEKTIKKCCNYFIVLEDVINNFECCVNKINSAYIFHLDKLQKIVAEKTNFNDFALEEELVFENTALLVQLLFNLLKVNFFLEKENEEGLKEINIFDINRNTYDASSILSDIKY